MKRFAHILLLMLLPLLAFGQEVIRPVASDSASAAQPAPIRAAQEPWPFHYSDSAIYQGMHFKLDLGNSVYTVARSKGAIQSYEMLMSVNLLKRFYPTVELGYALAADSAQHGHHVGQGGFMRVGLDINPLRKNRNSRYALLAGVRLGWDVQQFRLSGVSTGDTYWRPGYTWDSPSTLRGDCWGEVVACAQVWVAGPVFMGWAVRMKFLFTRNLGQFQPYYVPGYGTWGESQFSFNYYVGIKI